MIRKKILVFALVSLCSGAHANVAKDASRVAAGAAIGAAGMAAAQATFNAAKAFVYQDSTFLPGIDYRLMRLSALVGATVGLCKTTYIRTLRAQYNMWFSRSSNQLIALAMNDYSSDAELVNTLERYCIGYDYPLVTAKRELSSILAHMNSAACLIEQALEDIDQDSLRAEELNDWLTEIYITRTHIAYAVDAIDKDSRILSLMDAQHKADQVRNKKDETNAIWFDLLTHTAISVTKAANSK
jgi:hypothetical protein